MKILLKTVELKQSSKPKKKYTRIRFEGLILQKDSKEILPYLENNFPKTYLFTIEETDEPLF
ncbi:MAG TPA: hypothetical protein PK122_06715 [Candidatus Paceibacterota bacterium]|nr:hypothetical protein [Candidatus Paceibacterota bacterium]